MCLRPAHFSIDMVADSAGNRLMETSDDYVYLDWAASAPLHPDAVCAMTSWLEADDIGCGANPNSLHTPGRTAFKALEDYRREVASMVNASRPDEIVFTGGATESDNALIAMARASFAAREQAMKGTFRPKVITSSIEHDAVANTVHSLERDGFDTMYMPVDRGGFVDPEALAAAVDDTTVLVSIQAANAEIGTIQTIRELAAIAHEAGALFHTDATQAVGKIPFDVRELGVDAAAWSAHKLGGPKGVGALYVKVRTPIFPLLFGGGQEGGRRSGTQNLMGVAGLHAAMYAALQSREEEHARQMQMRDRLYAACAAIPGVRPTIDVAAGDERYLPNIVNIVTPGNASEYTVLKMDSMGYAVSGGSACASRSLEPSHVLKAIGVPRHDALCEMRISFGRTTTDADIDGFVQALSNALG